MAMSNPVVYIPVFLSNGDPVSGSTRIGKKLGAAGPRTRPLRKLKPGPGLTADVVSADQQRRLRLAMIDLAADRGYENVTVRALTKRAGSAN